MTDRIAAVVVTYNRKSLLGECLDGLLRQTHTIDAIFILDNASTDGTQEFLKDRGYLQEERIQYVRLPSNTGGAGGFHAGLRYAFDAGYDWFWLMDDDVEAFPDGLEKLLTFMPQSECIHGVRIEPDGRTTAWDGRDFDPIRVRTRSQCCPEPSSNWQSQKVSAGCFEGMLVSRRIVEAIGFPEKDFFVCWDDTLYGFLASRFTTVIYANATILKRKRSVERVRSGPFGTRITLSPLAAFYFQRNRFLVARRLQSFRMSFWLETFWGLSRSVLKDLLLTRDLERVKGSINGVLAGLKWISRHDAN